MRLLVTGATGVLGREVVPRLLDRGDTVHAVVRHPADRGRLAEAGARPTHLDLFDPAAVAEAVRHVDGVLHLATAIPPLARMHRRRAWRTNDELRSTATATLVDASLAADVEVVLFPSITFNYADGGTTWLDEDAPIDPPFAPTRSALTAEEYVRRFAAAGRRGVVLRLARLYGPGVASAELVEQAQRGRSVVIGRGDNLVSSLHAVDAGTAVVAGLDAPSGTYNIADDHPQTALALAEAIASGVGGRPPRSVPRFVARLLVGGASELLTRSQRVSNRRFRTAVGWEPTQPDAAAWWRETRTRAHA